LERGIKAGRVDRARLRGARERAAREIFIGWERLIWWGVFGGMEWMSDDNKMWLQRHLTCESIMNRLNAGDEKGMSPLQAEALRPSWEETRSC
jgi:hypothetical protein